MLNGARGDDTLYGGDGADFYWGNPAMNLIEGARGATGMACSTLVPIALSFAKATAPPATMSATFLKGPIGSNSIRRTAPRASKVRASPAAIKSISPPRRSGLPARRAGFRANNRQRPARRHGNGVIDAIYDSTKLDYATNRLPGSFSTSMMTAWSAPRIL